MKDKNDGNQPVVKYSGNSNIPGGNYPSEIRISGRGKIEGDLECKGFTCSGWVTCLGTLIVHGPVRVSGRFKGEAHVFIEGEAAISGALSVKGNMTVMETLRNSGIFTVNGDVKARRLDLGGIPRIRGQIYYVEDLQVPGLGRFASNPIRITVEELLGSQRSPVPIAEATPQPTPTITQTITISPPPRFCPFCGTELDDNGKFCGSCGNKFE